MWVTLPVLGYNGATEDILIGCALAHREVLADEVNIIREQVQMRGIRGSWFLSAASLAVVVIFGVGSTSALHAQALGWEGETGVFVTPFAYTASAAGQKLHPVVAYHYFNAGPVVGQFHEASIEVGIGKRLEVGYTHEYHAFGSDPALSFLWQNGFEIFNGKVNLVPENSGQKAWVPAISVGVIGRANVRNAGNYMAEQNTATMGGKTDGDVYLVATKIVPQIFRKVPVILSGGVRGTNAELWGMSGNAPDWEARGFGAVAFVFTGPKKSSIIVGSEASQQPHHPMGFPTLNIPTTLTYCARFVPNPKYRLNVDFGVAQVGGQVSPTVNLQARHQFGAQVTYGF
jgi:hypothetical protein